MYILCLWSLFPLIVYAYPYMLPIWQQRTFELRLWTDRKNVCAEGQNLLKLKYCRLSASIFIQTL
jgi:hypothetical protein